VRFQNKVIHWKIIINHIISAVYMSGSKTSKAASPDIREFAILKSFKINIHLPKTPIIKEIIWSPPIFICIKVNTDGAATKNPPNAVAGGIFRNDAGNCLGCFTQNLGTANAYYAELLAAILAMEFAQSKCYNHLWLETDSQLVCLAIKSSAKVPWDLSNRWHNCMFFVKSITFVYSHVYREGNTCADDLANLGLNYSLTDFVLFDSIPDSIRGGVQ